jgi:hypothetical protein
MLILTNACFAQITASGSGRVLPKPTPSPTAANDVADAVSLTTDFQNFTYSEPGQPARSFDLKNGVFTSVDKKTKAVRSFQFRKKYFFDVTGDEKTEAIIHLLADACEFCEDRSYFFLFSAIGGKPSTVFSFGTGAGAKCGLKEVIFDRRQIVIDVFGDCEFPSGRFEPVAKSAKRDVFTRIALTLSGGGYAILKRESMPFPEKDIPAAQTKIKFGMQ